MTVSLYTFVDLFDRALATADHLLDKAMEHASGRALDDAEVLGWRLIDDMQPLGFQLMVVVNFSRQWPARVVGIDVPEGIQSDLDAAGLKAAIADARRYLAALMPEQFEGREDVLLTVRIGDEMEPTLPAAQWLSVFATTNIHFHLSIAYGILRSRAVPLAKPDLFARGL